MMAFSPGEMHVAPLKTMDFVAGKPSFESKANGGNYYLYAGKK